MSGGARWSGRLVVLLAAAAMSCQRGVMPTPSASSTAITVPAMPSACDSARNTRRAARERLSEGHLDRALRLIASANRACPTEAALTWTEEIEALASIGRWTQALSLAEAIDGSPTANPEARKAAADVRKRAAASTHADGDALLAAGLGAKTRGDVVAARQFLDASLEAFETDLGANAMAVALRAGDLSRTTSYWADDLPAFAMRDDDHVIVVERSSLRPKYWLEDAGHSVTSYDLSPDGRRLAVAFNTTPNVRVWTLGSGLPPAVIDCNEEEGGGVTFAPNGTTLLVRTEHEAALWDLAGDKPREVATEPAHILAASYSFAPSGDLLMIASRASVVPHGIADGIRRDALALLPGGFSGTPVWSRLLHPTHEWDNAMVAGLSPDGRTAAVGYSDGTVEVFDPMGKSPSRVVQAHGGTPIHYGPNVRSIEFSPDSHSMLTAADDGSSRLWDLTKRTPPRIMEQFDDSAHWAGFRDDGKIVVSFGGYKDSIRVRSLETGDDRTIEAARTGASLLSMSVSPDGKRMATLHDDDAVRLWALDDPPSLRVARGTVPGATSVALSPDGRLVVAGGADASLRVWTSTMDSDARRLEGHTKAIQAVTFSHDGRWLASASADATIRLWPSPIGAPARVLQGAGDPSLVAFSPDDQWLASGGYDGNIRIWPMASGGASRRLDGHLRVQALAVAPDGRTLAVSSENGIALWPLDQTQQHPSHLGARSARSVNAMAFSPSGETLIAATYTDLGAWSLLGRAGPRFVSTTSVRALAFTGDDRWIWTGGEELQLRSAATMDLRATLGVFEGGGYVTTPRGFVELLGEPRAARQRLVCRIGSRLFPFDLCEDRVTRPALLSHVMADEAVDEEP
jgi:WD40 repeat protein